MIISMKLILQFMAVFFKNDLIFHNLLLWVLEKMLLELFINNNIFFLFATHFKSFSSTIQWGFTCELQAQEEIAG